MSKQINIIIKRKGKKMESLANNNYYLINAIVAGANRTGKTTFLRQLENGSPEV